MSVDRGGIRRGKDCFAKFPPQSYATIQEGLLKLLVREGIGRNGWAVMVALCRTVYFDGRLGKMSSVQIEEISGLTAYQVARGKKELRDKGIIIPVYRKTAEGYRHVDRSNLGHVAQFCFTKNAWSQISTLDESP